MKTEPQAGHRKYKYNNRDQQRRHIEFLRRLTAKIIVTNILRRHAEFIEHCQHRALAFP
jgi:hypothetical protein